MNVLLRIIIRNERKFSIKENDAHFKKHELKHSKIRILLYYHKSPKSYKLFVWNHEKNKYSRQHTLFENKNSFTQKQLSPKLFTCSGSINNIIQINSFIKMLINSKLTINDSHTKGLKIDLNEIQIKGLSKLNAYSKIIDSVYKEYKIELTLIEAKNIYNQILINKNY